LVNIFPIITSLDFYLTSSAQFARCIKQIDAGSILHSIEANYDNSLGAERFNESILRVLCLNQAIEKMQKETAALFSIRD
jgi:hypothetical protein